MLDKLTAAQRKHLYGIAAAAILLLAGYNVIAPEHAPLWLDLAVEVFGLGTPLAAATTASTKVRQQIKDGTLNPDETL
ncbi:phage holin [Mycolicibacterium phlei]|uniref:phage holin n=1 Tax=Mycolicibacterium phlei TaxID=1771 RepID=UPI0002DFCBBD|nr:hypothetical protein [Mycolicibacterium phlei]MBF4194688.1 hypothetical protein [Mycolicibacterium phlei]